jgi:aspartokinase-like uncharacterized kinase
LKLTVVKFGGSLACSTDLRRWLDAIAVVNRPVIVVPGGGAFADGVRLAQAKIGFSDALAHRLALKAMASYGEALAELDPRFSMAAGVQEFGVAHARGLTPVWAPLDMVDGCAEIPASWDVTSDSLAAWLAGRLGARLVVVKSVVPGDGVITAGETVRRGVTDPLFPVFLGRANLDAIWLGPGDWMHLRRVIDGATEFGARIVADPVIEGN